MLHFNGEGSIVSLKHLLGWEGKSCGWQQGKGDLIQSKHAGAESEELAESKEKRSRRNVVVGE